MKIEFVPVDYDYFDFEGRNYVYMVGRNNKGEKICVVDSYFPNFYVLLKKEFEGKAKGIAKEIEKIEVSDKSRNSKVEKVEILNKKFLSKNVVALRVFVTNHKDAHEIASKIGSLEEIEARREYDIPLITKYIKENKVYPLRWYKVDVKILSNEELGGFNDSLDVGGVFLASKFEEIEDREFTPKVLAFDIETESINPQKGDLLSVSLFGENFQRVLTWKKCNKPQAYVEIYKNESEVIDKFAEYVRKYNPDILTGYFSDGFDLPFLSESAKINKQTFAIGLNNKGPQFTRGRIPSCKIAGITHVDLFRFVDVVFSQYLQSETLGLDDVAGELIGEHKEDFDFAKLSNMKDADWNELFSYNLNDSRITYLLAQKLIPDMKEFVKIVKEPLFDVTRDRMSTMVENYLIHNLDNYNEVVEKRPLEDEINKRRTIGKFEGAFVFEPKPGLYEKIVFFDFTSMYPSVIITYNLSKSTFIEGEEFSKEEGFFPGMLREVLEKRKKYKKEYAADPSPMKFARSNAYKLLANAAYGYQAFSGARYYCREAAAATAKLARENIKKAIKKIEDSGHKIIYSDTDSIAFLQGDKTNKEIVEFLKEINDHLPGIMELDLEDFYKRGLFVSKRTTETGAKKKYALVDYKGKIKIRGFETVRRDWCNLARNLQSQIIGHILKEGNEKKALELLKETIKNLRERKVKLDDLVIRTQLKKPIKDYLSKGPHVIAAEKMIKAGVEVNPGTIIHYFVGEITGKGKRVGDRVFLINEDAPYEVEYYLNNQVLPAVENIFEVFGVNVIEDSKEHRQKKLF